MNRKHKRIGHVFQGRFKSILVDSNRYIKELVRYIHLNPVRAGMVNFPEEYQWCSHSVYLGSNELVWLTKNPVLNRFSDRESIAIADFQNFVRKGAELPDEIDFKRGKEDGILGDDDFVAMVREKAELMPEIELSISELIRAVCDFYGIDVESVMRPGKERRGAKVRGMLALMVREVDDLTLEELGRYLGRDVNGLSRQAARMSAKSLWSSELAQEIEKTKQHLLQMSECPA